MSERVRRYNDYRGAATVNGRPLSEGDYLTANPCYVKVTQRLDGASTAWGWCSNCKRPHILDARLFDSGRGPWRRVGRAATSPDLGGAA